MTFHFGVKKRLKGHIAVVFGANRQPQFSSAHFALAGQIMDSSDICEILRVPFHHYMA
jgi:hypothetical protein